MYAELEKYDNQQLLNELFSRDNIVVIAWVEEDFRQVFQKHDVEPSDEDVKDFMRSNARRLEDRSIELGWDVLDDLFDWCLVSNYEG